MRVLRQPDSVKDIRVKNTCELANFSARQEVLRRVDKTCKAFCSRFLEGAE